MTHYDLLKYYQSQYQLWVKLIRNEWDLHFPGFIVKYSALTMFN